MFTPCCGDTVCQCKPSIMDKICDDSVREAMGRTADTCQCPLCTPAPPSLDGWTTKELFDEIQERMTISCDLGYRGVK